MSPEDRGKRGTLASGVLLASLIALSFALRFYRLGSWSFDSDETFTLRDSLQPRLTNPRPLFYLLNHYLVQPLIPLDEFGLRLLAALFGTLAVPALYLVTRRLVGTRAGLLAALLLAVSPLHVHYSQFARYWTLVFLLSAIYPYALYLGFHERNRRALALGLVTLVLAIFSHPASVLVAGGFGFWALAALLRGGELRRLWRQPRVRWGALAALGVLAVTAARFVPMLLAWIQAHDTKRTTTEFLLHLPGQVGVKQLLYLAGFVESLTVPLAMAGALGIYLLWLKQDRSLALLLACMLVVPVTFLVLLSLRTPVSAFYLVPTLPIFFIAASVFLDRLADLDWDLRPPWLLSAGVTLMIVAAGTPTLLSQYIDGRRYDFRRVARWLAPQIGPEDILFSDQAKVLEFYLPGTSVHYLRGDPAPLAQSERALQESGHGGVLWVVSPASGHAFRTNPKLGSLKGWIYDNCQLRITLGAGRIDFRQYHLQVFRCPAGPSRTGEASH